METNSNSSSTPESEFDDWYSNTHKGSKASWEIEEDVDDVEQDNYSENS